MFSLVPKIKHSKQKMELNNGWWEFLIIGKECSFLESKIIPMFDLCVSFLDILGIH